MIVISTMSFGLSVWFWFQLSKVKYIVDRFCFSIAFFELQLQMLTKKTKKNSTYIICIEEFSKTMLDSVGR